MLWKHKGGGKTMQNSVYLQAFFCLCVAGVACETRDIPKYQGGKGVYQKLYTRENGGAKYSTHLCPLFLIVMTS